MEPNDKPAVTLDDYGDRETAWCPGCGNFGILKALKQALVSSRLRPRDVLFVSGIGQAAKAPHYLNGNLFNGLHGRALPVATGAALANRTLTVIAESGDGCLYGEGGNHFLAAIRRNSRITVLAHNNQVYGLTKGQASPTSAEGFVTKAQPGGAHSYPFNPVAIAVAMKAGFVARSFSAMTDSLARIIQAGIAHPGFALIDILQPCVSFNSVNTFTWYKDHCREIAAEHNPSDWEAAMKLAFQWEDGIPVGVIYRNDRPPFESHFPPCAQGPLAEQGVDQEALKRILISYI